MGTGNTSLRSQIDKWLDLTLASPLRVSRFGRTTKGVRYVCVEVRRLAGPLTIAFFHHEGGAWQVFPPRTRQMVGKHTINFQ
ncbi:hypothetical protein [Cupriavidus necator]|uniref:hypothetical protein n=1 Tax=Cupriavidus necator TaxID=106590 RepID=UPI00129EE241|nr:hypothetical protein [Cupriavidus necator]